MAFIGNSTTLAEVNGDERSYKIPAFIFLGLQTVLGLFGNLLVIYIYGHRMKKKKMQYFITVLAIYGILCCLLGLPLNMVQLWTPVTYPSDALCKTQYVVICFVCVASSLTLLVISIDRYIKVCRPTKPQLSLVHVKISFGLITVVSLAFAAMAGFVFSRMDEPFEGNREIMVHMCYMHFKSVLTKTYFMALVVVLIIVFVGLLVFYCLVWRTARNRRSNLWVSYDPNNTNIPTSETIQPRKHQGKNTTRLVVLISLVFVISFLPSLVLQVMVGNLFYKKFSFSSKALIEFVYAMWGLNSSMNPIIYGFYNRDFIIHTRNIFASFSGLIDHQKSVTSGE